MAQKGSFPLRVAFKDVLRRLEEHRGDLGANWLDPASDEGNLARRRASDIIAACAGELEDREQLAREAFEKVVTPLEKLPEWCGWCTRERAKPAIRLQVSDPILSGKLLILVPDNTSGAIWREIGSLQKGKPLVTATDPGALVAGRPVFILPDAN
jgi:hypothetical protein